MNNKELLKQLQIDCNQCSGLCCYALYLCKGESFTLEKKAGVPCFHLQPDFRCACYANLHEKQMKGCLVYDCFGAGQYVTQILFKQKTWLDHPSLQKEICNSFPNIMKLHQILYYLLMATSLPQARPYQHALQEAIDKALLLRANKQLTTQDISLFQAEANMILKALSKDIMKRYSKAKHLPSAIQKDFKKADLRGYDFTMSVLIGANLEGCNLTDANFLGADLRDASFANTDLSEAIFLTQIQINSAKGNTKTLLPPHLLYPKHW